MMIPVDYLPDLRCAAASPVVLRLVGHLKSRLGISVGICVGWDFWWIGARQDLQSVACEAWAERQMAEIRAYSDRFTASGGNLVWLSGDRECGMLVPIRVEGTIVAALVLLRDPILCAGNDTSITAPERDYLHFWSEEIAALLGAQMVHMDARGYKSDAMQKVVAQMTAVANDNAPLLIHGRPGCGKKHAARTIHLMGRSARSPYIVQKCIGLDDDTFLSEILGYRRGAFAWAIQDKVGLLDAAAGGTLVLDEIGALSLRVQETLLRFIETHALTTIGDNLPHALDVRLIATSSMRLDERVADHTFLRALYERLTQLEIPPLSKRCEDIPDLAEDLMAYRCHQLNRPVPHIPEDIMHIYRQYGWPGNISELRSEIEHLAVMVPPDGACTLDMVNACILEAVQNSGNVQTAVNHSAICVPHDMSIQDALIYVERRMIADALAKNGGNRTKTAEMLKISRRNLIRKIENLGIE